MIRFKLSEMLDKRGMTMYQVSKITGIRPNTLSQWVHNEDLREENKHVKAISVDVLDLLCEALNCRPDELLEHTPNHR